MVLTIDDRGAPIVDEKFQKLDQKKQEELLVLIRKNRDLEKDSNGSLLLLEENVALYAIETILDDLVKKYKMFNDVIDYLHDIKSDIINNLNEFLDGSDLQRKVPLSKNKRFLKYQVNVITDNSDLKGAPIIMGLNPTYNNLFGKVERESDMGTYITNFTLIRGELYAKQMAAT